MSEVKVDTISERTAAGGVTIDGVLVKDGVATFQTPAGSPLVFEGATANAFETTFAITDPTADRTITFPDSSFTVPTSGGMSRIDTWMLDTTLTMTSNTIYLLSDFTHSSDAGYSNYMVKNVGAAFTAPSTGVFTFPETGTWQASLASSLYAYNGYYTQLRMWVDVTADNGSNWYTNATASNDVANLTYGGNLVVSSPLNITDLSNDKVRFRARRQYDDAGYIRMLLPGDTAPTGDAGIGTFVTFTKLAQVRR